MPKKQKKYCNEVRRSCQLKFVTHPRCFSSAVSCKVCVILAVVCGGEVQPRLGAIRKCTRRGIAASKRAGKFISYCNGNDIKYLAINDKSQIIGNARAFNIKFSIVIFVIEIADDFLVSLSYAAFRKKKDLIKINASHCRRCLLSMLISQRYAFVIPVAARRFMNSSRRRETCKVWRR